MSSFYVRSLPSGNWRVLEEVWTDGVRTHKTVPKESYYALGINPIASLEEVRLRITQLNKSKSLERITTASRRVLKAVLVESVFFPEADCNEFVELIKVTSFGSMLHTEKLISHFQYIQKLINHLKIEPVDYFENKDLIYRYFMEKKNSLDYTKKLLRILNMWGKFICKKRGQYCEIVPMPKGQIRYAINDAYTASETFRGESDPLTQDTLDSVKQQITVPGNYEWLFISIWFGLRPSEIDSLKILKNYRISTDDKGTRVLWVYQSKLTGIDPKKRWKGIPLLYPEQSTALEYILAGAFKKPIHKTMRKLFIENITLYGGRKNFEDMMIAKGHRLEHISGWMGHQNIQTTWGKYRNKRSVGY